MASPIRLPPSIDATYGLSQSALASLGLTQTTTPGGGTGYKDSSGTIYTFNGSQFTPLPASAGGSSVSSTPAPTAAQPAQQQSNTSSSSNNAYNPALLNSQSVTSSGGGGASQSFRYNGTYYTTPAGVDPMTYLVQNGIVAAPPKANPNTSVLNLGNLGPGSTGANVQALQQWLVQNGYMTQAQMNTGPGIYGPQTKAAVASWQSSAGIDTQGNPGYFGPISQQYLSQNPNTGNYSNGVYTAGSNSGGSSSTAQSGSTDTSGITPTGNPQLDAILTSLQGLIASGKASIPPGLQITPALAQQFVAWAHQVVDPQTQQLINSEITNINSSLSNQQAQYEAQKGQTIQDFGANLAAQDNSAGTSGTAFSGLHNNQDQNLVNSTNRSLASLGAGAAYNIGQSARDAASQVGTSNAGNILLPSLTQGSVSQTGGNLSGGQGRGGSGNALDFSYNPSIYTAGTIPSTQSTAVSSLAGNYLGQYGTLANSNSGKSIGDLIGGISGLPSGYQIPSNLT